MSDKQISVSFLKIKERAQAVSAWDNMHDAWLDTEEDSDCAVVGHISDGYLYPIAVIDCAQYDQPDDSIKLAEFYASANPKAILELVADFEALKAENEALKEVNDSLHRSQQEPAKQDIEKRYRFLLGWLIERGVITNTRYDNGTWVMRGIYGVDDSGLKGAGISPEQAIDNAIIAHGLDQKSSNEFWKETHAAIVQPPAPEGEKVNHD